MCLAGEAVHLAADATVAEEPPQESQEGAAAGLDWC